ncbi:MAG: hypothetical protein OXF42_01755 [Candidatus Dadabacteria bacterium]|nr:hypothetical protein [Candidatus Dadabacteria bacterium]
MKERDWAERVAEIIKRSSGQYKVEVEKGLLYASQVREHGGEKPKREEVSYKTDLLVSEQMEGGRWTPRVVIETKVIKKKGRGVTTHDAITYSQKATDHKNVYPYLRYGISVGNIGELGLPGRLFRHGVAFDFMVSWKGFCPTEQEEGTLIRIVQEEFQISRELEEMFFDSRKRNRRKYCAIHKPLKTEILS